MNSLKTCISKKNILVALFVLLIGVSYLFLLGQALGQENSADIESPSVPSDLKAVANSSSEIVLSWTASTDNVGVVGYKIFRDDAQIATVTTGTSYTNTNLSSSRAYYYSLVAFDAAQNNSAMSGNVKVITLAALADTSPPSAPAEIVATAVSPTEISLSWSVSLDNVGVKGYKIYRSGTLVATVEGTTFSNTGLSEGTSYSFTVAAFDAVGNTSAFSDIQIVTTHHGALFDGYPPTLPTNLVIGGITSSSVKLSWTASTDNVSVAGYRVFRDGVSIVAVTGTSYIDTGLSGETSYKYAIASFDGAGNESLKTASKEVLTHPSVDQEVPRTPSGVTAKVISSSRVDISWTASTDNVEVAGYTIFRNNKEIGKSLVPNYSDNLSLQGVFSYTVSAYDTAGNVSELSAPKIIEKFSSAPSVSTTPKPTNYTKPLPDLELPSVPTRLVVTGVFLSEIDLSWNASSDNVGVAGYAIFRNDKQIASVTGTSYKNTGLTPSTVYIYSVASFDRAGNKSEKSKSISAFTLTKKEEPKSANIITPKDTPSLGIGGSDNEEKEADPVVLPETFSTYEEAEKTLIDQAKIEISSSATIAEKIQKAEDIRREYSLAPSSSFIQLGSTTLSRTGNAKDAMSKIDRMISARSLEIVLVDSDADEISDYDELYIYGTDSKKTDTDGDSIKDGEELFAGINPLLKEIAPIAYEDPRVAMAFATVSAETLTLKKAEAIFLDAEATSSSKISAILLEGKALPHSFVTLYIFSMPVVITVKADESGEWTYTIDEELEDGEHEVYVAMTGSSGKIIARSSPIPFVKTAEAVSLGSLIPVAEAATAKEGFMGGKLFVWSLGLIALAIFGGLVILSIVLKRKVPANTEVQKDTPQ